MIVENIFLTQIYEYLFSRYNTKIISNFKSIEKLYLAKFYNRIEF